LNTQIQAFNTLSNAIENATIKYNYSKYNLFIFRILTILVVLLLIELNNKMLVVLFYINNI
jgi:hypothetical protein